MARDIVTGREKGIQGLIDIVPKGIRLKLNPDRYCVEKFIIAISRKIPAGSQVLDAGAGPSPYKKYFSHCKYEATDFIDKFGNLDFVCSLEKIPRKAGSYDAIICTEVLEHVENPEKVLKELKRVLKKNGKLYITVPQSWKLHQEPYNFFYFTKYGLNLLLKKAGFSEIKISKKGGYFWFMADAIRFNGILEQYKSSIIYYPLKLIEFPLTNIIIPLIFFYLDGIDKEKKWTRGYLAEARN